MRGETPVREGLRKLPIRPIYLVSMEFQGTKNVITVGMFAFFSADPVLVGIGIAPRRYSYELIRKSGVYVVNVVDENLMAAVRLCGENSGRDSDKFRLAGLTAVEGVKVKAPCIKEAPVSLECRVVQEMETGDHVWFVGEVQATHVRQDYDWKQGLLFKWAGGNGLYYKVGNQVGQY